MSVATGTALAIGVGVAGAAGSIGGAALAAHGAGLQADAAKSAAQLQHDDAQQALAFQKQEYADQQKNIAPWLKAGQGSITSLYDMLKGGQFPNWNEQFQAPTAEQAQQTPGYQFQLQQGQQAIERSAAARGGLLTGGTAKSLDQYSQGLASTSYGDTYNRALTEYQQKYNQFQQNQSNTFNRYASIAGAGQTAAGQLSSAGSNAAGNVSNILLNSGQQIGNSLQNAAAARASGYTAYGNALTSGVGDITQMIMLKSMLNGANPTGAGSV